MSAPKMPGLEEDSWERFELICKPEQSGKTFVMIEQIIRNLNETTEGNAVINFIFCDNKLLLTKQTSERVQREVPVALKSALRRGDTINGVSYIEFSSRNDGVAQRNADVVITKIIINDIRNVICCTNGKRVSDISSIIRKLNTAPLTRDKFEFKIWLDEADKFTKYIDNTFKPLVDAHENVQVYCLTATPYTLFDKYQYMNVLPLEKTTQPNYHGWEDNKRVILDYPTGIPEGFIHHVLTASGIAAPQPGSKWFIPAERKKASHGWVRDTLVGLGFAVFVVNGDGLALTLPTEGRPSYCEKKTEELNKQIKKMCAKYDVKRFPLAITGNICVGRGISIMSPDFMFDFGIMSSCKKKAEASQNAGRLKGNIKGWKGYKPPTVYTTAAFDAVATEWEQKSRGLAELAFEKQEAGESTLISKADHKALGYGSDEDRDDIPKMPTPEHEVFDSFEEAKAFVCQKLGAKRGPQHFVLRADNFYENKRTKNELDQFMTTRKNLRRSMTKRTWPFYEDIANPASVKWATYYYPKNITAK